MSRYFQPISVSELKDKLEAGAKKRQITERGSVYQEWFDNDEWFWRTPWCELNEKIIKDMSKIKFYPENWDVKDTDVSMTGLNTLPNGMPYLGILAGGDGEVSVFTIIYWDGKSLRGYVPESGNIFNPDTRAAWGYEDNESDESEAEEIETLRRMGHDIDDVDCVLDYVTDNINYDCDAMSQDIMTRIIER